MPLPLKKGLTNGDSAKDMLGVKHLVQSQMCLILREESPGIIQGLSFSPQLQHKAASSDPLKCHGFHWLQKSTIGKIMLTDNIPVVLIILQGGVCVFLFCVK